ncbi:MAG: helix-turn-helix domain-containing protein [Rhodobacterales bacterium]|nr:helix-turn-helix domain-containing protein [Rhodobacterales bacterium]
MSLPRHPLIAAEQVPPLPVTPAPENAPIVAGTQVQTRESQRGFRPSGTKDWLLIGTTEGQGYVRAGADPVPLARGDILLFAPDTAQEYGYLGDNIAWANIWVHFRPRPHWIPWLVWPQKARGLMVLPAQDTFAALEAELMRTVEAQSRPTRLHYDKALNALERVLIACDEVNPLQQSARIDPRIRKALDIVGERLAAPLNVDGLAREVGLSRSRFSVLFTEQTNLSPQSYIEFMRLTRAAQLLRMTSWSVGQIAGEVGIPNPYYFSTRFRARYGMPPSAFRAKAETAIPRTVQ